MCVLNWRREVILLHCAARFTICDLLVVVLMVAVGFVSASIETFVHVCRSFNGAFSVWDFGLSQTQALLAIPCSRM